MTYVDAINAFEMVWWPVVGFAVLARSQKSDRNWRRLGLVAAICLILFGISDAIELYTKAWWRPWWLMVSKGVCLTGLAGCALTRILWSRPTKPHAQDPLSAARGDH